METNGNHQPTRQGEPSLYKDKDAKPESANDAGGYRDENTVAEIGPAPTTKVTAKEKEAALVRKIDKIMTSLDKRSRCVKTMTVGPDDQLRFDFTDSDDDQNTQPDSWEGV